MKVIRRCLMITTWVIGATLGNAMAGEASDAVELTRSVVQVERKAVVAKAMELTQQESQAFWPVYNEYWNNLNKINDRKVKLIMDYAKNYGNISDTMAKDMLKEFFDIQNATLKLKKKYVKKFENVLPPKKVFRYFQTENKLDALINIQLASEIPLMR